MHSPLLKRYLGDLAQASDDSPVLDMACGGGRNGLYLVQQGIPVVFADIRSEALQQVADNLDPDIAQLWQVDLEQEQSSPLACRQFSAILVFRYLHRPLLPAIREAVLPGGLVIYETFTREQPKYGRPKNPDFLLRPGELEQCFRDWQILHSFEGITAGDDTGARKAIAQIVARKPTLVH
jgi:SAM-dependent methyltransferase